MENDEIICLCALNRILGFEPKISRALIDAVGSARGVFKLSEKDKLKLFGPFSKISPLIRESELDISAAELERLGSGGMRFIPAGSPGYPRMLLECEDAPLGLYFRGSTPPEQVFDRLPQIAVVGTRDISLYGKEWCRKIVGAMAVAEHKPLIVSGFAIGTDIIAHLAAIEVGLPTVAVLPTGIDDVYPLRHRKYAETLCSTAGCALVTDYPPGTEPKALNFIRRNRIIAGICGGTILIESKIKGGGMITARLASSYGRDVLALPGRADDLRSQGCNRLLMEKIAEPLTDTVHFLDTLGLGVPSRRNAISLEEEVRRRYSGTLDEERLACLVSILSAIRKQRGITLDELCRSLCLTYGEVARCCGMLESDGIICTDILQRCSINVKIM